MARFAEIFASLRRMPVWVQIWMLVILMPVNFLSLFFIAEPGGLVIAALAVGGMMANLPIMLVQRGFGAAMSVPHVILWTPAVLIALWLLVSGAVAGSPYAAFLWAFCIVNAISLGFDIKDTRAWMRGKRGVA
jgi:hypothetical protein